MESLAALADVSIRRACGFAGLGIGTTMLALSFDLPLAFRCAGGMTGLVCLGLLWAAWRAPRRDIRRSELWAMLPGSSAESVRALPRGEAQHLLAGVLRARLIWHAERVALAALGFWGLSLGAWLVRALAG